MLGLGALAFGSGATTFSGAFSSDFASPQADLRVIADAGLRVRSARDTAGSPIVVSENPASSVSGDLTSGDLDISDTGSLSTDFSSFKTNVIDPLITNPGKPTAAALEINEGTNNELGIRSAFSNRLTGSIAPLLEVVNNTGSAYNIKINYAENDDTNTDQIESGQENGYGADVNAGAGESDYTTSASDELSRQEVQGIYQFRLDDTSAGNNTVTSTQAGSFIGPDPTVDGSSGSKVDEGTAYELGNGEKAYIRMDFNTDAYDIDGDSSTENLVGKINSAAGSSGNAFSDNSNLDLLDTIYVTGSQVTS